MAEAEAARQAAVATQIQLETVRAQLTESGDALALERQVHAATEARLHEARRQLDEASNQLAHAKTELGAEIERAREQTDAVDARQAQEKRALRAIDQSVRHVRKVSSRSKICGRSWLRQRTKSRMPLSSTPVRSPRCARNGILRRNVPKPSPVSSKPWRTSWPKPEQACRTRCGGPSTLKQKLEVTRRLGDGLKRRWLPAEPRVPRGDPLECTITQQMRTW
ncbi:hypothetical protein [Mycetohabitans rhizoxinica]|uniref:hypothetical protein n=1 Tax=Mycetohabitans rhizoxinica TaxID=412963 RepID=UPI0030D49814